MNPITPTESRSTAENLMVAVVSAAVGIVIAMLVSIGNATADPAIPGPAPAPVAGPAVAV